MYVHGVFFGSAEMEFDWVNMAFEWEGLVPKDVEESFEDPFSCKLLPDSPRYAGESRYFNLGMAASGYGIFQRLPNQRQTDSRGDGSGFHGG